MRRMVHFCCTENEDNEFQRNGRWSEKIADDPMWEQAIADRVRLLVHRDVNRPCVVIWSMGKKVPMDVTLRKHWHGRSPLMTAD